MELLPGNVGKGVALGKDGKLGICWWRDANEGDGRATGRCDGNEKCV